MTIVALFAVLWSTRGINPLRGDTYEYLYFDQSRSVGYPAFVALVRFITGGISAVVPAQIALLALSLMFLSTSIYKYSGRAWFSIAFHAAALSLPTMWYASAFLMSEAISAALIASWCAQLLRMITARPSPRGAMSLVALSSLATAVRPSLIALLFGSAVFLFVALCGRERRRAMTMLVAGLLLALGATPVAQLLVHGSPKTTSPFARGVLQHTLFCAPDRPPLGADALFVEQSAAPVRRYIESAPPDLQEELRRNYSQLLRFSLLIPVLGREHHSDVRSQVDPYLLTVATQRLNASCFAKSVAREYARMAFAETIVSHDAAHSLNAFMHTHPPVVVKQYPRLRGEELLRHRAANDAHAAYVGVQPSPQDITSIGKAPLWGVIGLRLAFGAAALLGLCAILALPMKRRFASRIQEAIAPIAALGIAFHGTLFITAIVEIGLWRYVSPLWPVVCTILAVAAIAALRLLQQADRTGSSRS